MPEHLFHYTSINTLALILQSRSIRLSPLHAVDDLTECLSADEVNYGQYVFITCWTSGEEESIPFWKMYTPDMTGVRLKLPIKMFKEYEFVTDPRLGISVLDDGKYATPMEEVVSKSYMVVPQPGNDFFPVEYVDSISRLGKKLHKVNPDGSQSVSIGVLAKEKTKHWAFQEEWRHKLIIVPSKPFPSDFITNKASMDRHLSEMAQFVVGKPLGLDSYYLNFDEEAFDQMEILLGPKQSEGDKLIVQSLRDKFNPKAKILESKLSGAVK